MNITEIRNRIAEGIENRWVGGVAIVWDKDQFDVVPHAYLNDISWCGRASALHCQTFDSQDAEYILGLDDKELARELDDWHTEAVHRDFQNQWA